MKGNNISMTIRIDADLLEEIKRVAELRMISIGKVIHLCLSTSNTLDDLGKINLK